MSCTHPSRKKPPVINGKWGRIANFFPALFALEGGDGPEAQEYSRLRGQYEALRQVAIQKKINLELLPPSPEAIVQKERLKAESKKKK